MTKVSEKPLISVIVPIYKVEKYLDRCIQSIINQTYKNLEIILVDDGSPDNCPKMCDEWAKKDKRIKVIHKENGGLSDARNNGIETSNGEYLTFIDSDDYVDQEYVLSMVKRILNDNSDMVISSHKVIFDNGNIIDKATNERCCLNSETILERMLYDNGIDVSAWAKLYKKSLFDDIKFPIKRLYEDSATTYKLIDKSSKISINYISNYNYIIRNNSISQCDFNLKKMDLILSTEEMCSFISSKYPKLEKACNRRLMYAYLSTLSQLALSNTRFKNVEKKLMNYIKTNRKIVLKDKKIPKRDRLGLISTMFGFKFYKFIWRSYKKIFKR